MTDRPQKAWSVDSIVREFEGKTDKDFFRSERIFLDRIAAGLESVMDIGCASGRFLELLSSYGIAPRYLGIDVAAESIANARRLYPQVRFLHGDALDMEVDDRFDLVNATGVMQHEPAFDRLIERMLGWSARYVLFDVKLARQDDDLIDLERAYCTVGEHRLYFIVLAWKHLRRRLLSLPGVAAIHVYGYHTPQNRLTTLPPEIARLVSAGVLLERGAGPARLTVDLPEEVL